VGVDVAEEAALPRISHRQLSKSPNQPGG
jgi:hypothetical protein